MTQMKMTLRTPENDDVNFIFNSWLKSYRSSDFAKPQCNEVYYGNYKKVVKSLLDRSLILVACNADDTSQICGYVVYEDLPGQNTCIHYIYTKFTYRKFGVAKKLVETIRKSNNPILVSHYNDVVATIGKKIVMLYDPYQAMKEK